MKKLIAGAFAIAAVAVPLSGAQACRGTPIGSYITEITQRDIYSSSGTRLTTVGAILQQDRANMHRFGNSDNADGYDDMFLSAESRALIPRWIHEVPSNVSAAIRRGQAYIDVQVYEGCIDVYFPG